MWDRKRREKLQLTGWHGALPPLGVGLCLGASHLSRGKSAAAEIGSLKWQQCGEVKRKLKNSSYIIGFMQPFISSRHNLNVGSRQRVVIRKENAHISSQLPNTLLKAVLSMAASCRPSLRTKKKLEHVTEKGSTCLKRPHSNKWHNTTSAWHQRHRAVHGEVSLRNRHSEEKRVSPDLWFIWKVSTASHYLNTECWWVCVKMIPGLLCVYTDSRVLLLSSLVNRFEILLPVRGINTRQRRSWWAIDTLPSLQLTLPFNCCSKAIKTHKELQSDPNLDHTGVASNILRFRIALFCEMWAVFSMATLEKSLHQSRSKYSWCKNTHY